MKLPFVYVFYTTSVWPTVIHSFTYLLMISSGVPNAPEYMIMATLDDALLAYHDSNMKTVEPRQQWLSEMTKEDQEEWERVTPHASLYQYQLAEDTKDFYQQQTGGM